MRRGTGAACPPGFWSAGRLGLPPVQSHALQGFYVHGEGPAILEPQEQGVDGQQIAKRPCGAVAGAWRLRPDDASQRTQR